MTIIKHLYVHSDSARLVNTTGGRSIIDSILVENIVLWRNCAIFVRKGDPWMGRHRVSRTRRDVIMVTLRMANDSG